MPQIMWSFQLIVLVGIGYLWNQPTCSFDKESPEYTQQQLINTLQKDMQQMRSELTAVKAQLTGIDKTNMQMSAFSAYMDVGVFLPENDTRVTVPLNSATLNLGNDYDNKTSIYSCPVSGVYYFTYAAYSANIRVGERDRTLAILVQDDVDVNAAFCYTTTEVYIFCQATNSAVVQCPQGGQVRIITGDYRVQMYGTTHHRRTTFTGFLLYLN